MAVREWDQECQREDYEHYWLGYTSTDCTAVSARKLPRGGIAGPDVADVAVGCDGHGRATVLVVEVDDVDAAIPIPRHRGLHFRMLVPFDRHGVRLLGCGDRARGRCLS